MKNEEKLMHVVVTLDTTGSKSANYILGRITGAIETIIIDNEKGNGRPLIISDPDNLKKYILRFWATNEQMNVIRATLPRLTRKLAEFQYYRVIWKSEEES